jgi:CBS domain-containing protein
MAMTMFAPTGPASLSPVAAPSRSTVARPSHNPRGPGAVSATPPLYGSLVADVMTRDVATVSPSATLRTAALLLSHKKISGLPVVNDDGVVVGVLSEKDIIGVLQQRGGLGLPGGLFDLLLEPSEARQKDMLARTRRILDEVEVKSAMTSPAQTIAPNAPTLHAIERMLTARINRLPVVENGRLVGIVTRRDALSAHLEPP